MDADELLAGARATALEARSDIDAVELVRAEFLALPATHKRAFAAWVLFKFPR
jgi:hypothetical protein